MAENQNILVIGSGGREHAIIWKLSQSPHIKNIYCAPGSYGIGQVNKVVNVPELSVDDKKVVVDWCRANKITLVAIGPEDPLAKGLADALTNANIKCFGPSRTGAQIESDKDWSKSFMVRHNIPTARYKSFTDAEKAKDFIINAPFPALVVKAAGLAAGKGVIVAENTAQACQAVDEMLTDNKFGSAGDTIVVEELLEGEEVSVLAFTDGSSVSLMLPAQDHKRIGDGDTGLNTGGMGAYCPCPLISSEQLKFVEQQVIQRAVDGLKKEGIPYVGVLYAGMMLTNEGPKTLEFNCRFGDPETEVILPLLDSDLYEIMEACCNGTLRNVKIQWKKNVHAVGVVMASKGYPVTSTKGSVISGLSQVSSLLEHLVYHCGTVISANGALVSNGGRVLLIACLGSSLRGAAALATAACKMIHFPGAQFRKDIAHKAISIMGGLSYLSSGVDIEANAALINAIEPAARSSHRAGVLGRLGCYGGLYHLAQLSKQPLRDPILVEGTDGVGTKIKIAEALKKFNTIGQDLVAMCVNDILCAGAEPFAFLDYIACGRLNVDVAAEIVEGIARACQESGCALLGGETAEMPAMYEIGKYDLAGFAVGVVESDSQLPRVFEIQAGDVVLGFPSTGVHSNGYSLVQRIIKEAGYSLTDKAPFSEDGKSFGEVLLTPTGLYVKPLLNAVKSGLIKGLAHITGGGLLENIPRILPDNVSVRLNANNFTIHPIFGWLAAMGQVTNFEMLRTFNCGVGMVAIVAKQHVNNVLALVNNFPVDIIGEVEELAYQGSHQVQVENFTDAIEPLVAPYRKDLPIVLRQKSLSYKDSGVDIEAGDSLVSLIKPLARSTFRPGVMGGLGGFGGLFRLVEAGAYRDPALVMGTDGVGTKLLVAQTLGRHRSIGEDLVAMCANDILCNGAEPLTFLDYFACGALDVNVARDVVAGIAEGCRLASAALIGGETAEMPGMYAPGIYDIAGFALGVVEKKQILPRLKDINVGDVIIGLPSNGVHANGFSLIRKIMEASNVSLFDKAPFSKEGLTFGEELLKPSKIYVKSVLPAIRSDKVKAIAHITGGGLLENIPRVIPDDVRVRLNAHWWNIQPVFSWIADAGGVSDQEMLRTFNCGLGMVLVVSPEDQAHVMNATRNYGAMVVGSIQARPPNRLAPRVIVDNFSSALSFTRRLPMLPSKRVAVLISGNGTNLQALIDATQDPATCLCSKIVLVISNKQSAYGLKRAEQAGIPTRVFNHKDYKSRVTFDQAITGALETNNIDIICLAGFMRILSEEFVKRWHGRLINIHPSLLPSFAGMNAIEQAFEAKAEETGCTVHFVDEGVDTGAILLQEKVPVLSEDNLESLTERVHHAEHRAYPAALRLIASGRVRLTADNQLLIMHNS